MYFGNSSAICSDCKAEYGKPHLVGCDIERCPHCQGQLVSCDCGEIYDIDDTAKVEDIESIILVEKKD